MSIFSGVSANAARLLAQIATQLAVTPILLSRWNVDEFGFWLLFATWVPMVQLLDLAIQTYISAESMRLGTNSDESKSELNWKMASGRWLAVRASAAVTFALFTSTLIYSIYNAGVSASQLNSAHLLFCLAIHSFAWTMSGVTSAIAARVASNLGHFPRYAWLGLLCTVSSTVALVLACVLGASPAGAIVIQVSAVFFTNLFVAKDAKSKLRRMGLSISEINDSHLRLLPIVRESFKILLVLGLDILRQSGLRILVAALRGAGELTRLATSRTLVNFGMQAAATLMQPIQPELMRRVRARDSSVVCGCFRVYLASLAAILPISHLILDNLLLEFYEHWTRGAIPSNGPFLSLVLMAALILIYSLPFTYLLQGLNRTTQQLKISLIATSALLLAAVALTQSMGVIGVGWALVIGESCSTTLFVLLGSKILNEQAKHVDRPIRPLFPLTSLFASFALAYFSSELSSVDAEKQAYCSTALFTLTGIQLGLGATNIAKLMQHRATRKQEGH